MKKIVLAVCCAFGFSVYGQQMLPSFSLPNKNADPSNSNKKRTNNVIPLARNAIYLILFGPITLHHG